MLPGPGEAEFKPKLYLPTPLFINLMIYTYPLA